MGRIWMSQVVSAIADLGRQYFEWPFSASTIETAQRLCNDLMSGRGEASGTALAREVVNLFRAMDAADRIAFLEMLNEKFSFDQGHLREAAERYAREQTDDAYLELRHAIDSPRRELLRRINMAPGGTAVIIEMRELLLGLLPDRVDLTRLDYDFRRLFNAWFNRGFLQFERIDWRTPAATLEKLIAYEAVHEIQGWDDLRRRLADDRRCFAFFHPALPDEPLIFVEVALTRGLADRIQPLLDAPVADVAEQRPDTAIFYSISNCQVGLTGISFGNLLIKQVVDALAAELPSIRSYATLSPIPGFRAWLRRLVGNTPPAWLNGDELEALKQPGWADDEGAREQLEKPLMRLCARYLTSLTDNGQAIDPVARFHLGNGASIERINWAADLSPKGLQQSAGLMVNYRYAPDQIVGNHETYVGQGRIAYSGQVKALL